MPCLYHNGLIKKMDAWKDGPTDGGTNGLANGRTDWRMEGRKDGLANGRANKWANGHNFMTGSKLVSKEGGKMLHKR